MALRVEGKGNFCGRPELGVWEFVCNAEKAYIEYRRYRREKKNTITLFHLSAFSVYSPEKSNVT